MNTEVRESPPNAAMAASLGTGVGLLGGATLGGIENTGLIQKIREYSTLSSIYNSTGMFSPDLKWQAMEQAKYLRDRSRMAKTLPILKGRVMKSIGKRGLLGAGLGLGAGLLGATAMGSFD
jgi:hypothetical protein